MLPGAVVLPHTTPRSNNSGVVVWRGKRWYLDRTDSPWITAPVLPNPPHYYAFQRGGVVYFMDHETWDRVSRESRKGPGSRFVPADSTEWLEFDATQTF